MKGFGVAIQATMVAAMLVAPGTLRAQQGSPASRAPDSVSLSLRQAVVVAGDTAPLVSLARLQTSQAEGRLTQARSVYFPTVGGSAGWVRQTMNRASFGLDFPSVPGFSIPDRVGPFNIWDGRGRVAQTLFSPSSWLRASAARRGVEASAAGAGAASQAASARTAASYVATLQAEATVDARQREQSLAQELLDVAEEQLDAGVGTRLDVVRARTQVAGARTALEVARSRLTQARIELARSLGFPAEVRIALTDTLGDSLGQSSAPRARNAAVAAALHARPELTAARATLEAARTGMRVVAAERYGSLQLVGDYGLNGPTPGRAITTGTLSLRYSIPVFEGFRLEGRREEQVAKASAAELSLAELREQIAGEVESALAAVESGESRQSLAREQLVLAAEEVREARLLFGNGLASNIAVITAQSDLVKANDAMIAALAETARARVSLARAVGVTASLQ